jgi:non-heme chloroperoxidase
VPFADAGPLTAKLVKNAKLVVYKGAPHDMCITLKDKINEELISFIKS